MRYFTCEIELRTAQTPDREINMFELDQTLEADTVTLIDWPLSRVLLMNDRQYPWCILVPRRDSVSEIFELDDQDAQQLQKEICLLSQILNEEFDAYKINVGALGNMVRQLHVHIIARQLDDIAWPKPVWGVVPGVPYEAAELSSRQQGLLSKLEAAVF